VILIIDNYDSFVHNLARYVRECGCETRIVRNDEITLSECLACECSGIIISPGPKRPADAGVSLHLIRALSAETPLLGVCLGHQCLVEVFGGKTARAEYPLHGEASSVRHNGKGIFSGLPSPIHAGRYHSLIATPAVNESLCETAWADDGELMAVQHRNRPWFGVQFHPESLLTPHGKGMIRNFLAYCDERAGR